MKKVVVGISGGVDSSVAALLLKNEGYEVIGLFMRNWDSFLNNDIEGNPTLDHEICTQEEDYNDAKKVCEELKIPLYRIDFVKEYWDYVFTYFLEELKKGRTPNPDVMCNKYIKFDYFIQEAKRLGADYIATGHYARIVDEQLYKGIDSNKDQSYFLAQLTKEQLKDVLFPIGNLTKPEVRAIAEKHHLITAKKKDSTGICFIGERHFKEFLTNYLPNQPGKIVDIDSLNVVGEHVGLMYYTIGQRRGLNIGGSEKRQFVVGKNLEKNILYTAYGDDSSYLYSNGCIIESIVWNKCEKKDQNCLAKFRYRSKEIPVSVQFHKDGTAYVSYEQAKSVTPGQLCAFYEKDGRCIGSGIIKEVQKDQQKLWYLL